MGHFVMVLFGVHPYQPTLDSLSLFQNEQLLSTYGITSRKKGFQMTQGGHQGIIILPIKNKMAVTKKQCHFCIFCIEPSLHLPSFKVWGVQVTINYH